MTWPRSAGGWTIIFYLVFRPEVERSREEAQSKLGDAAYERAYTEGRQAVRVPDPIEAVNVLVGK